MPRRGYLDWEVHFPIYLRVQGLRDAILDEAWQLAEQGVQDLCIEQYPESATASLYLTLDLQHEQRLWERLRLRRHRGAGNLHSKRVGPYLVPGARHQRFSLGQVALPPPTRPFAPPDPATPYRPRYLDEEPTGWFVFGDTPQGDIGAWLAQQGLRSERFSARAGGVLTYIFAARELARVLRRKWGATVRPATEVPHAYLQALQALPTLQADPTP